MRARRFQFVICVLLALSASVAGAQQLRKPALGNSAIIRKRSTRFLAERGIVIFPKGRRLIQNPARMLAQARARYRSLTAAQANAASTTPLWQPVGPSQIFTSAYGAVAGRVTSIAADPSDPTGNTVYVGTAFGGVWKSTNAAGNPASVTFAPLTDTTYSSLPQNNWAPSLSIGALSVQPVSPGTSPVILAGTGVANDTTASYFGAGILRSTDGGATWSLISQSSDATQGANVNYSFRGDGFAGFAWGSVSGNPVVVAAVSQAQSGVETNAVQSSEAVMGIYYSTDLGQTWFMATITDPSGAVQQPATNFTPCQALGARAPCGNAVTSVVWNSVRNMFYAAVRFHGYYQSIDGQNWTRLSNQPGSGLTSLVCPPNQGYPGSSACPIYNGALAVQPVSGDTFALTTDINNLDQGLWQDACNLASGSCASPSLSFTQIPDAALDAGLAADPLDPTLIPQADYDLYLAAVPVTSNSQPDTLLFAGTADIYRCDLAAGCAWRNTTHAQSSDCNSAHVAPAQYAIDATFGANGLLYFGNDGGLWRSIDDVGQQGQQCSTDDANHFQNLNSAFTGSIAEVEDIAPDPSNPQTIMASLGTLGTAAPLGGTSTWQQVLDGEGDYAAIDPANPQNWYATSEFGIGINRCTQGTGCGVAAFGLPVIDSTDVGNDGYGQVIPAPWILDPQNSANIIVGTCRVWRGSASGGALTQVSPILDGILGPYCDGNGEIRSLAASGSPSDPSGAPEIIYAGMAGLYDGGATVAGHLFEQSITPGASPASWIDLSNNLNGFNPNGYDISSVYIDPHSSGGQTVYVTIQGFAAPTIYRSTDGGSTWQNITRNLANIPANSIVVDPNNANTVYVATDAGVYYTQNVLGCLPTGSNCWSVYGAALPNVPVTQLATISGSTGPALLAATFGRGIWQIDLPNPAISAATVAPTSLNFGNQPEGTTSASQNLLVTNAGNFPLQISSITITGEFTETDTCSGQSIASGDTCLIQVSFAPASTGAVAGLLTVYANLPSGGQLTVPLSGTGVQGAAVTLTPTALCFQATLIGQTTSQSCQSTGPPTQGGQTIQPGQLIVIADTGGTAATLTSVSITGDFAIVTNTCGTSLAAANTANDSCTISITFTPTASGNRSGVLTVSGSAGTQTAQLAGTGQSPATDTLSPQSLSFASQTVGTQSAAQQITLTNTGDQSVQTIFVSTSSPDFIAANDCGATLAAHSTCAILVSFLPSTVSSESAILTVSDVIAQGASSVTHSQQVTLAGTGTAPPGIASAAPMAVNFGYYAVGKTSPSQLVAVTNNGTAAVNGIQASITGDFVLQFASVSPCGATLSAGATCNIAVAFSPTQVNQLTGSLTIAGSNLGAPLVVALTGRGAAFTLQVDGSSSEIITGGQAPSPFQIEIDSVNASQGPVALSCSVVPATGSCTVLPASVTLTGENNQLATLSFAINQQTSSIRPWKGLGLALAAFLPIGFLARRSRGWGLLLACMVLALFFPLACGVSSSGGSARSSGGSGTPPATGQYTVTVTGTMPGLTQTAAVQITVQ